MSFEETAWGGQHSYGRLKCGGVDNRPIDMEYVLSQADADNLNRADRYHNYRAGETSGRFCSKAALHAAAIACYQSHFPGARFLIEGDPGTYDPQYILDGPERIVDVVNGIFQRCEELDWCDRHKRLNAAWARIWISFIQS